MRARFHKLQAVAITLVLGGFFLYFGLDYPLGTAQAMGPGYLPVMLAIALLGMAGAILIFDPSPSADKGPPLQWKPILWIGAGITAFAVLVPRIGLAPALFACTMLSAVAAPKFRLLPALALASSMALAGVLVFVVAIGLPIPIYRMP